jgi:hypothetical protein
MGDGPEDAWTSEDKGKLVKLTRDAGFRRSSLLGPHP